MLSVVQLSARCFRGLKVSKVSSASSYGSYIQVNQVQKYSRLTSRRPVAIVNEDELFEVEEAAYPIKKENSKKQNKPVYQNEKTWTFSHQNSSNTELAEIDYSQAKRTRSKRRNKNIYENKIIQKYSHENSNPELEEQTDPKPLMKRRKNKSQPKVDTSTKSTFTKLYENEKLLSTLMLEIKSRRKRKNSDRVLLEGTRIITDAIQAGETPEMIIFSNPTELKKLALPEKDVKIYKVPYRSIQLWSSLTTPPGIMGVFKTPDIENYQSPDSLPITIICDNIRDPGNMGSILRAAAGVGCEKVILTKGCVDLWKTKVLRSAAGAHFRLPIYSYKEWEEIRLLVSKNAQIVVADNKVTVEEPLINENESEEIEQVENIEENLNEDSKFNNKRKKYEKIDLFSEIPIVPYFSVDYTQGETVIIVGGETEGLSEESFQLVDYSQGVRVNVPLNNGLESLNSGMALGVIAFEIKRQFLIGANKVK